MLLLAHIPFASPGGIASSNHLVREKQEISKRWRIARHRADKRSVHQRRMAHRRKAHKLVAMKGTWTRRKTSPSLERVDRCPAPSHVHQHSYPFSCILNGYQTLCIS